MRALRPHRPLWRLAQSRHSSLQRNGCRIQVFDELGAPLEEHRREPIKFGEAILPTCNLGAESVK